MASPERKPGSITEGIEALIVDDEWLKFTKTLDKHYSPTDTDRIRRGFYFAGGAHAGQRRETGHDYFTHAIGATEILINEFEIYETNMAIAELLHDVPENTKALGDLSQMTVEEAKKALSDEFRHPPYGKRVGNMVTALTHFERMSLKDYHQQIDEGGPKVLILKLADRLHNTRTQWNSSPEKQERKKRETLGVYIDMFMKARKQYPFAVEYGIAELHKALEFIANSDELRKE